MLKLNPNDGQPGSERAQGRVIVRDTESCLQEETLAACICPTYFKDQLKSLQSHKSKEIFSNNSEKKAEKGIFQERKLKTFGRTESLIWQK